PTTRPTANARPRAACRADPRLRVLQRRARPGRLVQMAGSRADPCVRFRRDHDVTKSQRAVAMPLQISFAVTNHLSSRGEQAFPQGAAAIAHEGCPNVMIAKTPLTQERLHGLAAQRMNLPACCAHTLIHAARRRVEHSYKRTKAANEKTGTLHNSGL